MLEGLSLKEDGRCLAVSFAKPRYNLKLNYERNWK